MGEAFITRRGGGTPYAVIGVTYPSGSVCTCTNGTLTLTAKGTGGKAEKAFYNVSIADEKEVILIVSRALQKSDIMRAIIENAGPSTEAGAIVFSLPASEVAGFGMFEDTSGEEK